MADEAKYIAKRLNMPGLKPTDYYLYASEKAYFGFDMRQLVVLGLRMVYACAGGQITREQMLNMASAILNENLDKEAPDRPVYQELGKRLTQ